MAGLGFFIYLYFLIYSSTSTLSWSEIKKKKSVEKNRPLVLNPHNNSGMIFRKFYSISYNGKNAYGGQYSKLQAYPENRE